MLDPDRETVKVYRSNSEPIVLKKEDVLTIPELFPSWEVAIAQLWPPIFTEEETSEQP